MTRKEKVKIFLPEPLRICVGILPGLTPGVSAETRSENGAIGQKISAVAS